MMNLKQMELSYHKIYNNQCKSPPVNKCYRLNGLHNIRTYKSTTTGILFNSFQSFLVRGSVGQTIERKRSERT